MSPVGYGEHRSRTGRRQVPRGLVKGLGTGRFGDDLDFVQLYTGDDIGQALGWTQTLADERPDLLDRIALDVAKVTGA